MAVTREEIRAIRDQRKASAKEKSDAFAAFDEMEIPPYLERVDKTLTQALLGCGVFPPRPGEEGGATSVGADAAPNNAQSAQDEAEAIVQRASDKTLETTVIEFNERHFVTIEGGKTVIAEETVDPELNQPTLRFHKFEGFRQLYADQHIYVNERMTNVVDAWTRSPSARRYRGGMAMIPNGQTPPEVYNLYQGWGVEPQAGSPDQAIDFIRTVICDNDATTFEYVMGWLAFCVQHPGEPAEVVLVLRGGRGTGKGTLGELLLRLFGAHGMHVLQQKHLVGNFNAHLRNILFMFADEAFFAGDRAAGDVLKGLVTERRLTIERKGFDAFTVRNRLSVLMATNHDWVVPAGSDERRFCVLDVSDIHKQDHAYFGAFKTYLENGGDAAFLHYLLSYDLSGFNIRRVPSTQALVEQKAHTLPTFDRWLFDKLWQGVLSAYGEEWNPEVSCTGFRDEYAAYVRNRGEGRYTITEARWVGRRLKTLIPSVIRRRAGGRHTRQWVYGFPSLAQARAEFAAHALGGDDPGWPDDGTDTSTEGEGET